MIAMRQCFIGLLLTVVSSCVMAEWQLLSADDPQAHQYIDLEKVTQSGPMAIYRQVQVLLQGPATAAGGALSMLAHYEYDCMNAKVRLLRTAEFSRQWAEGQALPGAESGGPAAWVPLAGQPLGQKTFDLICPGGKDD